MDKKTLIASIVAVVLTVAASLTQIDFKAAVCGSGESAVKSAEGK